MENLQPPSFHTRNITQSQVDKYIKKMEKGQLKITFETDNVKHLAVMSDSVGLEEIYNVVNSMLIGMTFHQEQIDNYLLELAESIETNK
jgi:pantothenate kinase